MIWEHAKIYFLKIRKIDLTKKSVRIIWKHEKIRRMGNPEGSVVDTEAVDDIDSFYIFC